MLANYKQPERHCEEERRSNLLNGGVYMPKAGRQKVITSLDEIASCLAMTHTLFISNSIDDAIIN